MTGRKLISGQEGEWFTPYTSAIASINTKTGTWPGLYGAMWLGTWSEFAGAYASLTVLDCIDYWNAGGLCTVTLSFPNPYTGGEAHDVTAFNADDLLWTPSSAVYQNFYNSVNSIIPHLKQLQSQGVAVLLRPMHEMNGNWFWWGAVMSAGQYISLWQNLYRYLTVEHGLQNLLWVYSPDGQQPVCGSHYPGAAYVDVTGMSVYTPDGVPSHWPAVVECYQALLTTGKPVGFSEFGPGPTPTANTYDYTEMLEDIKGHFPGIVYWMSWNEEYGLDAQMLTSIAGTTPATPTTFLDDPWIINRDDLPAH